MATTLTRVTHEQKGPDVVLATDRERTETVSGNALKL
jgi:hypothetical protein